MEFFIQGVIAICLISIASSMLRQVTIAEEQTESVKKITDVINEVEHAANE